MLNSSIELESLIRASGDKSLLNQYNKATLMAEQILSMQSELPNATNQTEARKNIIRQKEEYEQLQLDLMRKSTDFGGLYPLSFRQMARRTKASAWKLHRHRICSHRR